MKKVYFIEYEHEQILYIDFSNCSIEETFEIIKDVKEVISAEPPQSVLTLTNVTGGCYDHKVVAGLKDLIACDNPYVRKGAIVGMDKEKQNIYDEIMESATRLLLIFDDINAAKAWLIERRQFPRYKNAVSIKYSVIGNDAIQGEGILKNISLGGICLSIQQKLERGTMLNLKINLSKDEPAFELTGVVSWVSSFFGLTKEDVCILGIQFRDLSDIDHQKLFRYVFECSKQNPPCSGS